MGILRVESGAEMLALNRRERNKMAVGKGRLEVHDVVVQEGIPAIIPVEACYLGWQESLQLLTLLVEPEIKQ